MTTFFVLFISSVGCVFYGMLIGNVWLVLIALTLVVLTGFIPEEPSN